MLNDIYQKLLTWFGSEAFAWNVVANGITFLALIALFYQIRSTNRQYAELNRGYLDPAPILELIDDSIDRIQSAADGVDSRRVFGGINCRVALSNVGNLPLKYEVLRYDVEVSNGQRSEPLRKEDKTKGIIYPHQSTTFFLRGIPFDPLRKTGLTYAEIQSLVIRCRLEIEYWSSDARKQTLDRVFHWKIVANQANLNWDEFNDTW